MLASPAATTTPAPTPPGPPVAGRARPLRGYLAILALGLALPAAFFAGILLWQFAAAERARLEERVPGTARAIARAIDRELAGLVATLEVLSLAPPLQTGDVEGFHSRAVAVQRRTGIAVVLRGLDGQQLADSRRAWGGPLPKHPLPALDAEVLRTGRPVVSDLFFGAVAAGTPLFAVEGPVLVGDAGEVRYFLGLSLPAERLLKAIEGQRPPPDWTVGVIDGAGVVLARAPRNAEFAGKPANPDFVARAVGQEGWWRGTTLDGTSVLSGFSRTELAGWVVAAGVPESALSAPLRRSLWTMAGLGAALAALAGALAVALGRRIAEPIAALARAAEALGRGEAVAPVRGPLREAVTVGEALAAASAGLREREARLREGEERLRLIVEGAKDHAIVTTDGEGRITGWSPGAAAIFGWTAEEAVGQPVALFFTPEDRGAGVPAREIETARREGRAADERWHLRKDGSRVFMNGSVRPLHDALGRERGFVKVARDDTARHEAERRRAFLLALSDEVRNLTRPEEILAAKAGGLGRHLAVSRVGYAEVDPSGLFLSVERDWTDGTVGSVAGRHRLDDSGPTLVAELKCGRTVRVQDAAADARIAADGTTAAYAAIRIRAALAVPLVKGGRLAAIVYLHHREPRPWSDADAELAREVAERSWSALARARAEAELRRLNEELEAQVAERTRELVAEMGRRQEAEAQLRQAQKIEAVGQLTGGIAHDFNNLLQAIVGSLELLRRGLADGSGRARRHVDNATEAAMRAAALTQRLLAFARRQTLAPEPLDVNRLVAGMSDLLRRTIAVEDVRVETALAGDLWRAHADPNQLENAILNLAVNARDAMPGGGRITVETANARLDAADARTRPEAVAGEYVVVAVGDTGGGMTAEVAARAFDPFFTTKPVGQGTGLGLSQVHGLARQSGGHAEIESEPGRGTTVRIYLPRYQGPAEDAASGEAGPAPPPLLPGTAAGRGETVLVVEDEEPVRRASVEALREIGYRILEADGAAGALRLLDAHPEVALLLTDVVMPDLNGRRLAEEAVRRRPGLKVLLVTGYAPEALLAPDGVPGRGVEFLGKPFTLQGLAVKVREVLSGRGQAGAGEPGA